MKRKYIGISFIILALFFMFNIIYPIGSQRKILEPSRQGKNIPNDVIWDEDRGVYKLVENTELYNPNIPKNSETVKTESFKLYFTEDTWIENNKGSLNPLDQAIVKWLNNRKLNAHKSYYSSEQDETFKEIKNLGVKYLPEMIERIRKDDGIQTGVLMDAVSQITQIDSLKQIDLSPEGKKQWDLNYNDALQKAPLLIKNISDTESLKYALKECGIFIVPYAIEKGIINDNNPIYEFDAKNFSNDELKILKNLIENESK